MMSECVHCGISDGEDHGIVIGVLGEQNETVCSVCRAAELSEWTALSEREAQVAAFKQLTGASHSRIADILGITKSAVDEYSRRLNGKVERAEATVNELTEFY